jgi:PPOX class probable F420-dependent enzyme
VEEARGDAGLSAINRFFDRIRSPAAARAAAQPGQSGSFKDFAGNKYTLLVTFKRNGEPLPTPVWAGLGENGGLYVRTEAAAAKVKRIRNDPHVRVAHCDLRGKPKGPLVEGRARIVAPDEEDHAEQVLKAHYGLGRKIYEGTAGSAVGSMAYIEVMPV